MINAPFWVPQLPITHVNWPNNHCCWMIWPVTNTYRIANAQLQIQWFMQYTLVPNAISNYPCIILNGQWFLKRQIINGLSPMLQCSNISTTKCPNVKCQTPIAPSSFSSCHELYISSAKATHIRPSTVCLTMCHDQIPIVQWSDH